MKRLFVVVLMCLCPLIALAAVEVSIDRNPVRANESFQLVFSLDHDPDLDPNFSMLQQHFLILGSNRGSSISIINGEYQRSVKYTLQLMAKESGDYIIPAINFGQHRSQPVPLTVHPPSAASQAQEDLAFEVIVRESEVYVQGQVIVKLRLLSASNISAYQFGEIALRDVDAVIEPLGEVQSYQTRIAGRDYLVLERRFALFPQQSGRLGIPPILAEVRLPATSSFDLFGSGGEMRRLRSQPAFIEVKPIPPEADGAYWLPAHNLVLREELPDRLEDLVVGEPITRSLSIVADGLTAAQLPEIDVPQIDGVKQYPDQPGLQNRKSGKGISGTRTQKIAMIPSAAGVYRLPEINLRWWNLRSGQLETATIAARELRVVAASASDPTTIAAATDSKITFTDSTETPARNHFWLVLSLLLTCGWAINAIYWYWCKSDPRRAELIEAWETTSLRSARAHLQRTCAANDAPGARVALLAWGKALLSPQTIGNLNQLERRLGQEFSTELARLNQCLYSASPSSWQGDSLQRLCLSLESEHKKSSSRGLQALSPLNPQTSSGG